MSRTWPPYRTVRELVHAHRGVPAVVMGGGESLLPTLDAVDRTAGAIYISANDHGAKALRFRGFSWESLSYAVCLDKIEHRCRREVRKDGSIGEPWNVPVISRHMFADFRILDTRLRLTGLAAAWIARLMGCDPIILGGMDCYVGDTYWNDPNAHSSSKSSGPKFHILQWRQMAKQFPANYQAHQGELTKVFPGVGTALLAAAPAREELERETLGDWVEFAEPCELTGRPFPAATRIEVKPAEARKLVLAGKGRKMDSHV